MAARGTALPATDGASHVGFLIRPAAAGTVRASRLRISWDCVDHHFTIRSSSRDTVLVVPDPCPGAPSEAG